MNCERGLCRLARPEAPSHAGLQDGAGMSWDVTDPALPSAGTRLKDSLSSRETKALKTSKRSEETAGVCDGCKSTKGRTGLADISIVDAKKDAKEVRGRKVQFIEDSSSR